jgi:hypothetical protein
MKFAYIFATVGAAVAMAAPAPGAEPEARAPAAVAEKAARVVPRQDLSCLPRSCQVSGVSVHAFSHT